MQFWNFSDILLSDTFAIDHLILLNTRLINLRTLENLFARSNVTICADGAANRLYQTCRHLVPSIICGDMDSIAVEVLEYYRNSTECSIKQISCQDSTDFDKCISLCNCLGKDSAIVVLGGIGGRFDQTMSTLNTMYRFSAESLQKMYMITPDNLLCCLSAGQHEIECDARLEGPSCGLIPLGKYQPVTCETSGLQWNLSDDMEMEFGALISTSNRILFDQNGRGRVTVHVKGENGSLLWCCEHRALVNT